MHTTKLQTLKHFFFMDRNTKGMKKIFMVDPYTFSYQMLQNKNSYLPNNCATAQRAEAGCYYKKGMMENSSNSKNLASNKQLLSPKPAKIAEGSLR